MTEHAMLKKDWEQTREEMERRGFVGSLARYTLLGGGVAAAFHANYMLPELVEAVAQVVEADMAKFSLPARELYGEALLDSIDNMAEDVNAAIEWVWTPVSSNIEHFRNGTLIDHHKDWISKVKVAEMPLGELTMKAWDMATKVNEEADTAIGRWMRPAIGIAAGATVTAMAGWSLYAVGGKTLNAMAGAWHKGGEMLSAAGRAAGSLFKAVRHGAQKGIAAALGRELPAAPDDPFAGVKDLKPAPSLRDCLITTLKKAGADKDAAAAVVDDVIERIGEKDRTIEALEARSRSLEEQVAEMRETICQVQERLNAAEDPRRVEKIVQETLGRTSGPAVPDAIEPEW